MIRVLLPLIVFLLPLAAFWLYLRMSEETDGAAQKTQTYWFVSAAFLAVLATFALWFWSEQGKEDRTFIPPHWEDGEFVPGRYELNDQ